MKFEITEYEGSICNIATLNCNDKNQLLNRLIASEGAVLYHVRMKNDCQVKFFQKDVDIIKKKLLKL